MKKKQKKILYRIIVSAVFLALAIILSRLQCLALLPIVFYAFAYITVGYDVLRKAFSGIIHGRVLDENFLMAVATLGAVGIAIYEKTYDFSEAVFVILLYQTGELLQSIATGKTRKSIASLMDIRPDLAYIEVDGKIEAVSPESVEIGEIIVVKVGEKIPIDGIIVDGNSELNTSSLTGESLPVSVGVGSEILSGSINLISQIKVRTTKKYSESTVSKILELVENASSKKAKEEEFISKFARIYTPAVCISALLLAILPPVFNLVSGNPASFGKWIYQALTFLVISCPCALVLSIPLAFFGGIGGASRKGILIKGSNIFSPLSKVKTVVFDKTGTLTKGSFEVVGIHQSKIDDELLLEYTTLAESASTHPISQSFISAYGKKTDTGRIQSLEEISGYGVIATIDGKNIIVGNEKLMKRFDISYCECKSIGSIVHIAIDGEYMGHIVVSDRVKPTSKSAIENLKSLGINKTVMLTGDNLKVASHVAKELGIDDFVCSLLPSDKVLEIEKLLGKSKVAFVGDGINDAPSLVRADVGIGMGGVGSDSAIEASDVVIMDDNPLKVALSVRHARKVCRIVKENIALSLVVKAVCLVLGAIGISNMWFAIFADVGVMLLAVLNSLRALR